MDLFTLLSSKLAAASVAGKAAFVGGVAVVTLGAAGAAVALPGGDSPATQTVSSSHEQDDDAQGSVTAPVVAPVVPTASAKTEDADETTPTESPKPCPSHSPEAEDADEDANEANEVDEAEDADHEGTEPEKSDAEEARDDAVRGDANEDGHRDCGLHHAPADRALAARGHRLRGRALAGG